MGYYFRGKNSIFDFLQVHQLWALHNKIALRFLNNMIQSVCPYGIWQPFDGAECSVFIFLPDLFKLFRVPIDLTAYPPDAFCFSCP